MGVKKIMVTGGSGFLGSYVADRLSDAGHKVLILDNRPSSYIRPDQDMLQIDLLDKEAVMEAVKNIDIIYHFGGFADLSKSRFAPTESMHVNVMGTAYLLEAATSNNVERFIFASSIYVYSQSGSFYRVSKHACELMIEEYHKNFSLNYTILRFGTLYGCRSDSSNSVRSYLEQALLNKKIVLSGDGEEVREFIHAYDAADISLKVLEDEFAMQTLILTGHHRMKVVDLAEMINEILGGSVEIEQGSGKKSHYKYTPYSYLPRIGRKIVQNTYHDLGQGLLEVLEEIDT